MKLTKISLLLACPFTLAICAGHVKADSVTTTNNPDTALVAQSATSAESTIPTVSAATETNTTVSNETDTGAAVTADQNLTTVPTGSSNTNSDLENKSDVSDNTDASVIVSNDVQSSVVPETSAANQTTTSNTVSGNSTAEQETFHSVNETSSSDLAKATTKIQSSATSDVSVATQMATSSDPTAEQEMVRPVNEMSSPDLVEATTNVSPATATESVSQSLISKASDTERVLDADQDIIPETGSWTFHAPFYGYAAADTSSEVLATYRDGQVIQYTGVTVANNDIWLEYTPVGSVLQYIPVLTESGGGIVTSIIPASGSWTFHANYDAHSEADIASPVIMVYANGDSVKYSSLKLGDSDIWLVVHPSADVTQYIAVLTSDGTTVKTPSLPEIPRTGKWTFASATDVHSAATMSSSVVATYDAGQSVTYTNATIAGGYIWLSYTGGSGATRYVAVLKSDEATLKPETIPTGNGTGWPFAKAYTGYFEEGQQFGDTTFYRAGGPDHYFHDGFDFGSAIYGSGSTIKAVATGKVIYAGYYDATLLDVIVVQAADGTEFMYQEFSSNTADIHVSVGQEITLGQSIAKLTGTHLHLGITPEDWRTSLTYAFNPAGPWINPITYISDNLA